MKRFAKILSVVLAVSLLGAAFALTFSAADKKTYSIDFQNLTSATDNFKFYTTSWNNPSASTAPDFENMTELAGTATSVEVANKAKLHFDAGQNKAFISSWSGGNTLVIEFTAPIAGEYRYDTSLNRGVSNYNDGNFAVFAVVGGQYTSTFNNETSFRDNLGRAATPEGWEANHNGAWKVNPTVTLAEGAKLYWVVRSQSGFLNVEVLKFGVTGPAPQNAEMGDSAVIGAVVLAVASAACAVVVSKKRSH